MQRTKVTDAGVAELAGLSGLQNLNLRGTRTTDAGLAHLKGLRELKKLWLVGTKVTAEGVRDLQLALPRCEIELNAEANGEAR